MTETTDAPVESFGTFEKGGVTREAQSIEHAVKFAFEGWREVDGTAAAAAAKHAEQVAAKAAPKKAAKAAKSTAPTT
jgi:poly-gamma-glutamate capsule biosynthesis protein CapA/YwtB (metallophosphatase superfamily)